MPSRARAAAGSPSRGPWRALAGRAAAAGPRGLADVTQNAVAAAESFEGTVFRLDIGYAGPAETACRQLPDVSAASDGLTGGITIYIGAFGGWTTIGGTSTAAPMWAECWLT